MTDIVRELRHKAALKSLSGWGGQTQIAMGKAADEIERLRDALRPFAGCDLGDAHEVDYLVGKPGACARARELISNGQATTLTPKPDAG
jgi:hypothetical protein